jgi:hypothetical protein
MSLGDASEMQSTDLQHLPSSNGVMPAERHKAITKQARTTKHIERFNHPLRQRLACLVRAMLSCSKKGENPIGAITFFLCHDNLEKAAALPV